MMTNADYDYQALLELAAAAVDTDDVQEVLVQIIKRLEHIERTNIVARSRTVLELPRRMEAFEPSDHPGLEWRARSGSTERVPYWVAPRDVRSQGFLPKTVKLDPSKSDEQLAAACRAMQAKVDHFRRVGK